MDEILQFILIFLIPLILCYMIFGIPYGFIKNKNTKDISEYYYKISYNSKEDIFMNKLINYYKVSCLLVVLITFILFFSTLTLSSDSLINYIISNDALEFQKKLLSFSLSLFAIMFTAITIFISSKPEFGILFDTRTIIKIMKIKRTLSTCSICCLFLMIFKSINYWSFYLFKNEFYLHITKALSFWSLIIIFCYFFITIAIFLYLFIDCYFSDNTKQKYLTSFYKDIYKNDLQQINQDYTNDTSIIHLLNNHSSKLSCNEYITFISTEDEFINFSFFIKTLICILNIIILCLFQFIFSIITISIMKNQSDFKFDLSQNTLIISCSISLVIHLITSVISLSTSTKTLILRLSMFNWGYKIESQNKKSFKTYYSYIYNGVATNKKYNQYFRDLYNILVVLKRAIITDEECAKFYLDQIISKINAGKGDYLLYGISLYLYQEKYELQETYKKDYRDYLTKHYLDLEFVKGNMCAVLEDIDRANKAPETGEKKDKTEHEIKKEAIEKTLNELFPPDDKNKKVKITKKIKYIIKAK